MTAIAELVAEAIAKASEESVCMFRHDARETYGAPRFLTIADCEPDSVPKDNLCIAEDADSLDDADDRASSTNRLNPFSGKLHAYPPRIVYVRRDVFTDALSLLASRAAEAEGRAERAEARATRLREALALMSDAESPCGPLAHTIAVFALGTDDTAAGKGVG